MELFEIQLKEPARARVESNPANRWLREEEILVGKCEDGQFVSETLALLLEKARLWTSS